MPPDRAGQARETLEQSLDLLGIDALDRWLIHWVPADGVAAWRALMAAHDERLVRDIGVSDYSLDDLDDPMIDGIAGWLERTPALTAAALRARTEG